MKILIIGAGPAGYVAAIRAAQGGAEAVLVEAGEVGGTCLNWGCVPTKALLSSAEALAHARTAGSFGVTVSGKPRGDLPAMVARKNKIVATQVKGILHLLSSQGVRLVRGRARFEGPQRVRVRKKDGSVEDISADRILIASGSRPTGLPLIPFDGKRVISSNEAVHLATVPASLLIVGAGVIGCEFASLYRELGAEVTLIEALPRVLATEDEEVSALLEREMRKRGIQIRTSTSIEGSEVGETGVKAFLAGGEVLSGDLMLVAVGRSADTESLGLEEAGIRVGRRGEIVVDEHLETSATGIYAAGDVLGKSMLAHVASKEARVAVDHMLGDEKAHMSYDVIPSVIFTRPEIGAVGLREHEARQKGLDYRVGRFPFRGLGRAHAAGEIAGFVKIIAEASSGKVLGAHLIGPRASDLVHEFALGMEMEVSAGRIGELCHGHPTFSEALMEAAADVDGRSIHMPKPMKKGRFPAH